MARHHADDGERDGRHNDQRRHVRFKLRHHQQINQDETDPVSNPHIAESFVGDLPFAVPLYGELAVGILRLFDKILTQRATFGELHTADFGTHAKQAIQGAIQLACHIGNDKYDRQ